MVNGALVILFSEQSPVFFLIASHGWSASNWLAYILNQHKEITCAHSSAAVVASNSDELNIKTMLEKGGLAGPIEKMRQIRSGYKDRFKRSLYEIYAELEENCYNRAIGTVHTYRLRDLELQQGSFEKLDKPLIVANLIRHPVDLVNSGYGQFKDSFRFDLKDFHWTLKKIVDSDLEQIEEISISHSEFPGDFNNICFIGACACLAGLKSDILALPFVESCEALKYIGAIKKEEITTQPQQLEKLISAIGMGLIRAEKHYLNTSYSMRAINRHRESPESLSSEEIYEQWSQWQKDIFDHFFNCMNIREYYLENGYELDFIPL